MDISTVTILVHPIFNATIPSMQFQTSRLPPIFFSSRSSRMDSDDSTQNFFFTISNFNNSVAETPDEILDSELSPTKFSQPPLQPITSTTSVEPSLSPYSRTDATPTVSPLASNEPDVPTLSETINLSTI